MNSSRIRTLPTIIPDKFMQKTLQEGSSFCKN
jgi:hypothetical protein